MRKGIWALVLGVVGLLAVGCGEGTVTQDQNEPAPPGPVKGSGEGGGQRMEPKFIAPDKQQGGG